MGNQAPASVADRARRKLALRILPFVFLLYIVNYIDRTNVSVAKLTMLSELDFSEEVYGIGVGVFLMRNSFPFYHSAP
ncbi:MAG TPA: hypothetical protein VF879_03310 [Nitrospirales bacterium]